MSKYDSTVPKQARKLCEQFGAIDRDLAEYFGVSSRTINIWKVKHPAFRKALVAGKDAADDRVERALYERAIGYTFTETKLFQFQGEVISEEVETHVVPDTKACMYWLGNRRRDRWSFRPDGAPPDEETPTAIEVTVVDGRKPKTD